MPLLSQGSAALAIPLKTGILDSLTTSATVFKTPNPLLAIFKALPLLLKKASVVLPTLLKKLFPFLLIYQKHPLYFIILYL